MLFAPLEQTFFQYLAIRILISFEYEKYALSMYKLDFSSEDFHQQLDNLNVAYNEKYSVLNARRKELANLIPTDRLLD